LEHQAGLVLFQNHRTATRLFPVREMTDDISWKLRRWELQVLKAAPGDGVRVCTVAGVKEPDAPVVIESASFVRELENELSSTPSAFNYGMQGFAAATTRYGDQYFARGADGRVRRVTVQYDRNEYALLSESEYPWAFAGRSEVEYPRCIGIIKKAVDAENERLDGLARENQLPYFTFGSIRILDSEITFASVDTSKEHPDDRVYRYQLEYKGRGVAYLGLSARENLNPQNFDAALLHSQFERAVKQFAAFRGL